MSQAVWRQGSSTTPSLAAGAPARASSRWSEFPSPAGSLTQRTLPLPACDDAALDVVAGCWGGRVQVEPRAPSHLIEGERELYVVQAAGLAKPVRERRRPKVVRRAGVRPLLGAGRDEPHVTGGSGPGGERSGQRDERANAGRVVIRARRGRNAVRVRHRDHKAVGGTVPDPDHVPRSPLARHGEPLIAHAEPDGAEPRGHPLVRGPLSRRGRRAAARGEQGTRQTCAPLPRRAPSRPRTRNRSPQTRHKPVTNTSCSVARRRSGSAQCPASVELDRPQVDKVDARCARLGGAAAEHPRRSTICAPAGSLVRPSTKRVNAGRLHPLYRGVYALGHPNISLEGLFLAAVKACGPDAVLSHFSAAVLRGWLKWDGRYPEVTAPTARSHPGIYTHRANRHRAHVPQRHPRHDTRTHADGPLFLNAAVEITAQSGQRSPQPAPRHAAQTSSPRHHRGAQRLREILATAAPTKNEFEDVVLAILKDLPKPDTNQPLHFPDRTYFPDFRWPAAKLILEADSAQFHDQPLARADDATRQAFLEAQGERVLRVTWRQATTKPVQTRARIRQALSGIL